MCYGEKYQISTLDGKPNSATVMDLLSAIQPKAVLF
jgi:hypothetical protein